VELNRETKLIRASGMRYWTRRNREADNLPAVVLDALAKRTNRSKLNFYLTQNYYRIVREDTLATENPILEMFYVGTYDSKATAEDIQRDVALADRRLAAHAAGL
jgi:hypothetical protein